MPDELPQERTPRAPLKQLAPIAAIARNGMFATRQSEDGSGLVPIERRRTCACGREFTQSLMAPRELEAMERMQVIQTFMRELPDCFVPKHCPPCERRDLTLQSQLDEARARPSGTASHTLPDDRRSA